MRASFSSSVNFLQSHVYCLGVMMMTAKGSPRFALLQSKVCQKKVSPKGMATKKRGGSSKGISYLLMVQTLYTAAVLDLPMPYICIPTHVCLS